ncbi:hypothetical protein LINPERHAP1_LOCUS22591 [Linum perenne]
MFSKSTHVMLQEGVRFVLGVTTPFGCKRYLGMPSLIRRNKQGAFNYLKERVWSRIQTWRGKDAFKRRGAYKHY